ncbi:MAG TPA: hypothetical protein VMX36_13160 [Sedimentisphaerales bacterium]|nr:hypothetical protein [Sedimentisphaerales bacterium]
MANVVESSVTEDQETEMIPQKEEASDLRARMLGFESAISQQPGAKFGDDAGPLSHFFADGLYIRQYTGLKNTIAVSKLHKTNHPYFVLEGCASIITEEGPVRIEAPHWGITKAGTKRILYFHEETIWITVHATEETDLEKIEDVVIAKTYDDLPESTKKSLGIESRTKQIPSLIITKESEV